MKKEYNLKERLISFAIMALEVSEMTQKTFAGINLSRQLARSGTAPALNYGEALSAESRKDFIHKMKVSLKELRETEICLQIIKRKPMTKNLESLNKTIKEYSELIAIFVSSVQTAKKHVQKNQYSTFKI